MPLVAAAAVFVYMLLLAAMLAYGANCFWLVWIHRRNRHGKIVPPPWDVATDGPLPSVLVQLPVFNEENVVVRLLEAVAGLDWPRDRLQVQLLDDSTDATAAVAAPVVARMRAAGLDIVHLRRDDRRGFKAGALAAGLVRSDATFVAIFDADFVPPSGFLHRAVRWLRDPQVAAIQGRWTHLNRSWSGLTRAQALAIDGHFGVEQAARSLAGWLMNFNGSGGVWRRAAIDAAGGWSDRTLTEDLDLSYRAQLAGWRLAYDADLICPCELPTRLAAFKAQQRRWATGSMQTALFLLPSIWRAPLSRTAKLQATLHLTHYAVHALIAATAVLSVPCVLLPGVTTEPAHLWALLLPFALAMSGPTVLYLHAARTLGEHDRHPVRELGMLTLLGIGIAVSNARAVWHALRGRAGVFERTPKLGVVVAGDRVQHDYRSGADGLARFEWALAIWCLLTGCALIWAGVWVIAPFMLLDATGLALVAWLGRREARAAFHGVDA